MKHVEALKKSLEEWATSVKLNTHQELAKASFMALLHTTSFVDKFSYWLLLLAGATATLIISNLASIHTIVSLSIIKSSLFILILSGIAGLVVKIISIYIGIFVKTNEDITNLFNTIFEKHDAAEEKMEEMAGEITEAPDMEIDFNLVLEEFSQPFPKWYKKKIFKAAEETEKDPLWGYKRNTKLYLGQTIAAFCQVLAFMVFVITIAISL